MRLAAILVLMMAVPSGAAEVKFFQLQSLASFLPGTLDGVGIDDSGHVEVTTGAPAAPGLPLMGQAQGLA